MNWFKRYSSEILHAAAQVCVAAIAFIFNIDWLQAVAVQVAICCLYVVRKRESLDQEQLEAYERFQAHIDQIRKLHITLERIQYIRGYNEGYEHGQSGHEHASPTLADSE